MATGEHRGHGSVTTVTTLETSDHETLVTSVITTGEHETSVACVHGLGDHRSRPWSLWPP